MSTRYTTYSDGGGIMIGTPTFKSTFLNSVGDGENIVIVAEKEEENTRDYIFQGCVQGSFNVYKEDTSDDVSVVSLNGRYGVFLKKNPERKTPVILLERWE